MIRHTPRLTLPEVIHSVNKVLPQNNKLKLKLGAKISPNFIQSDLGRPEAKPALTANKA